MNAPVGATYNVRGRLTASELKSFEQSATLGNTAAGAQIPVLYGYTPVNGDVIAQGYIGSPQELVIAVGWGWGEIHQIKKTFVNGVDTSTLPTVQVHHYRGGTYQDADEWLETAVASYTDTLVLTKPSGSRGVAYSVFRMPASAVGGSPRFQAIVEGALVYDPTSSSSGDPFYSDVGYSLDFTSTTDGSTNAHTVTLFGTAYITGGYLICDGAGAYATVPDHGSTEFSTTPWTVEIRAKCSTVAGSDWLLSKSSGASPSRGFELYRSGSDLGLKLSSDGATNDIQDGVISTGVFAVTSPETEKNIVVEFTGQSYIVFVDGAEVWSTYTTSTVYDNSAAWQIGTLSGFATWEGSIRSARFTQSNFRYGGNHKVTNSPFADSGTYTSGYVYSDNPALCFGELATNSFYGMGTTVSGLSDAAAWDDELLRSGVKRARLSLAIYEARKTEKWLDYIATSADCLWFHDGTGVKILADKPVGLSNPSGQTYVADPDFETDSWTTSGGWSYGISYVLTEGGDRVITESGDYVITEDSQPATYCHSPTSPQAEGGVSKKTSGLDYGSPHVVTLVIDSITTGTVSVELGGVEVIAGQSSAGTYTVEVTPTASSPEPTLEALSTDSDACISHLSITRKYWLEETWVQNSLSLHGLSTNDTPTKVSVRYRESSDTDINWQEKLVSYELPTVTTGDTPAVETTIPMESVYRVEEANNKAETRLLRMQNRVRVSWTSTDIGLAYQRGTVVQLRSTLRGVDLLVLVESVQMVSPGRYKVSGLRYSDDQYPSELELGAGVIPVGAITLNDSATIPSGWAVWSSADGKFIRAWNDASSPQLVPGDTGGSATYAGFSGNTSTAGAHSGDDGDQFRTFDTVFGSAIPSYDAISGDVGGHPHTYSTGSLDPEIYAREMVFMKKTGSTSTTFPASALVFGLSTLSVPNLVRSVAYQNRLLKAASAPGNSGTTSKIVSLTTGSADDSHAHAEISTSPVDSRTVAGFSNLGTYIAESGGQSHTHIATLTLSRNVKRYKLALFSGSSGFTADVGTIIGWEDPLTGSPDPFPGWNLCDGGTYNGYTTPDLRDYFIEIAAEGSEGTVAGDNTLTLSGNTDSKSHEHRGASQGQFFSWQPSGHSNNITHFHTVSASGSYEPPYYVLYFLMYTG